MLRSRPPRIPRAPRHAGRCGRPVLGARAPARSARLILRPDAGADPPNAHGQRPGRAPRAPVRCTAEPHCFGARPELDEPEPLPITRSARRTSDWGSVSLSTLFHKYRDELTDRPEVGSGPRPAATS